MKTVAWKRSRVLKVGGAATLVLLVFILFIRSGNDGESHGWALRSDALVNHYIHTSICELDKLTFSALLEIPS